jgi:predicted RNase H-like nuclease
MAIYLGVDGCRAGLVSVQAGNKARWKIEVFSTIQELWKAHSDAELILIDVPIGMRDKGGTPRLCDTAARKYLTRKRGSSVFPTPCRAALYAKSYQEANQINKEMTGKGLSKQSWNISPKIRELDILLRENVNTLQVFVECGPELCYSALADGKPMKYYKKTEEGIKERLRILKSYCKHPETPIDVGMQKFKRKDVSKDDIMDAWILAIAASRGKTKLCFIPEKYENDSTGLPMRIAIPKFQNNFIIKSA